MVRATPLDCDRSRAEIPQETLHGMVAVGGWPLSKRATLSLGDINATAVRVLTLSLVRNYR